MLSVIPVILLTLILIGAYPTWPHKRNYGYYPVGISGVLVIFAMILFLTGYI